MKLKLTALIALTFCMLMPVASFAQTGQQGAEMIEHFTLLAHKNMVGAPITGPDGKMRRVTEQEADSLPYPLIPLVDRQKAVMQGITSAIAQHCDLDWANNSFYPFFKEMKQTHVNWNDYQLAYVSLLHGIVQAHQLSSLKDEPCTDSMKRSISPNLQQ